jgi:hypothetical protein
MILRTSISEDAPKFVEMKQQVKMPEGEATTTGGFLLGTTEDQYRYYIENDIVSVLEDDGKIVGFSIVLTYETLKKSDLWKKKDQMQFPFLPENFFEDNRIAYYEQLAVLPDPKYRTYAKELALKSLIRGLKDHDFFFLTVVKKPIVNKAPLPFMNAVGFVEVGEIEEHYEGVGDITSSIYFLQKSDFRKSYLGRWKSKMDAVVNYDIAEELHFNH